MKLLSAAALAALVATGLAGVAQATPLSGTFNINAWVGTNANPGVQTDPTQQALFTNPLTSTGTLYNGTYTGPLNFSVAAQSSNFLDVFIPGAGFPHVLLSAPGFTATTLIEVSFTIASSVTGTITHDDGVSLLDSTNTNLLPVGDSSPTSANTTGSVTLAPGTYQIWYVEANGSPSVLSFDLTAVPEPVTLGLFGVGLAGLGLARRRRG